MNKWHEYFMKIAENTAELSRDPRTKVGAVLVKDKKILSTGYNGPPRNFYDSLVPFSGYDYDAPLSEQKNSHIIHAEVNAILNYEGSLPNLKDSTLYVTISPCHECAKFLSQVGIKKIIYLEDYHKSDTCEFAKYILKVCGVELIKFSDL